MLTATASRLSRFTRIKQASEKVIKNKNGRRNLISIYRFSLSVISYPLTVTCAVSATGWGEFFIRLGVARDISAMMEYRAMPIQQAVDVVIKQKLQKAGGDGGVIAIDKFGNIGISFNSEGMYRAYVDSNGKPVVEIYKD